MTRRIIVMPPAEADLLDLTAWIGVNADLRTALNYIGRIEARFAKLRDFPNRGASRPEFGEGIRGLAFERRLLILYDVDDDIVRVRRVLRAERDLRGLTL